MNLKDIVEQLCACHGVVLLAARKGRKPIRTELREAIASEGRILGWKTPRGRGGRRRRLERTVRKVSSLVSMLKPTQDDIERCGQWVDHIRAERVEPEGFLAWLEEHLAAYDDDNREAVLERIHSAYDAVAYALRLSEKEYLGRRDDLGAEALACILGIEREAVDRRLNWKRRETYISTEGTQH